MNPQLQCHVVIDQISAPAAIEVAQSKRHDVLNSHCVRNECSVVSIHIIGTRSISMEGHV